jgi:hypothetical protein
MVRHIVCLATARVFDETISRNVRKKLFSKAKGGHFGCFPVLRNGGTAKTTSLFRKAMRKKHVY